MIRLMMLVAVLLTATDANACCLGKLFKRHHKQVCYQQQTYAPQVVICVPVCPPGPVCPVPVPVTPTPQNPPVMPPIPTK